MKHELVADHGDAGGDLPGVQMRSMGRQAR
jgi:hypothetical protein